MKSRLLLLFGILAFLLVMGNVKAYQQDLYYYNSSTSSDFSVYGYANISGNLSGVITPDDCTTIVQTFFDINTTTPYSYTFDVYINGTLNFSNTKTASINQSHFPLGQVQTNGLVSARVRATTGGGIKPVTIYLEMHSNCISQDKIYLVSPLNGNNMYEALNGTFFTIPFNFSDVWLPVPPASNAKHVFITPFAIPFGVAFQLLYNTSNATFAVPFNSGTGATIKLDFEYIYTCTGTPSFLYTHWRGGYYDPITGITTTLFEPVCTNPSAEIIDKTQEFNLSLDPLHNYVAWLEYGDPYATNFAGQNIPIINITTTDYYANLTCTAGNCINGTRLILCHDNNNILPDQFITQPCLPLNETAYIGFEDSLPTVRDRCTKTFYPFCFDSLENISANFPTNPVWSIFPTAPNPQYIATITGETSTRGFQSLKLWSIPPSPPFQPTFVNLTRVCGNLTSGEIPSTSLGGVNATFFIQFNFTFPSSTMHLMFDVKKCSTPVVQFDGWCGKSCYGYLGNCSIEPLGDYFLFLYDNDLATQALLYTSQSKNNWTSIDIDLSNNPNIVDHTYTISLGVGTFPQDVFAPYSWCSYFDNVRFFNAETSTLEQSCLDLYGKACADLTPTELQNAQNNACPSNPHCVGSALYVSNIQNGICVSQVFQNESTCVQQQQNQIISGTQSLFQPIGSVCNQIINQTLNQTFCDATKAGGWGWTLFFLTPIFWLIFMDIIVMIGATWVTKHMEIGIASGFLLLTGLAFVFTELVLILIAVIVVVGFIVGKTALKAVSGGS